ncbi:MAG: hypothetical protein A2V70_09885 [Planctomycetes bacterium RBG_13_63_9]|nr:MAG: hypothetical protein A2V70_09885 [Planctomycetes bacterium RBG_13_63_9]
MRWCCLGGTLLVALATWPGSATRGDDAPVRLPEVGPKGAHTARTVDLAIEVVPPSTRGPAWERTLRLAAEPTFGGQIGVPGLGLDDLQQIALQWNPTLVQAAMEVRAAQGNYVQAGLYPNPTIGYLADEVGNDGGDGLQGGFVGQKIVTAGKLRLGRAVASRAIQQARYVWEAQRQKVFNDVRASFYETLLAQEMIHINEELVGIAEEGLQITEKLLAAKEVSRADVLQARIEVERAGLNLNEARNHHRQARQRLTAVLGRPDMEPTPLAGDVDGDLPTLTWEDTLADLLTRSPELGEARAGVERARYELAHQCALRVPNFEIGAAVKRDTVTGHTVTDVEVGLPLPVFDRNQGNISKARARLVSAQREMQRIELSLRDRLATSYEQYANAHYQVRTYVGKLFPHAKESLELVRAGYREGEFDYLSLLTAQRTLFSVNLDYLKSLREFWTQTVELEGLLLRGGLERVSADE